ncbi:MAG: class I SAM-dependent methyltransferase [Solirubrobacteraceae bacterium]
MSRGHGAAPPASDTGDDWDRHWHRYAAASQDNPAQLYRRSLALGLLARRGPPERLLDVGSGQGDLLADAARRWPRVQLLGLEPSAAGIAMAREKAPSARFLAADLLSEESPPELRGWATHAVCSEVLEHVDDPVALLAGARALMAAGCRLVVTVPGGRMSAFDHHIGHRRHYDPTRLAREMREAGFDVARTAGAGFPFFNLYRTLVIWRGERLVDDVGGAQGQPSVAARAAMLAFRPLLALSLPRSPWGTQVVGIGHVP